MTDINPYQSAAGVESAIKAAAAAATKDDPSLTVAERIRLEYFRRLLSRVFSEGDDSGWLLKGGTGMLARIPSTRATLDIDLYRDGFTLDQALADLRRLAELGLGDHFRFIYLEHHASVTGDQQPYVDAYRVSFDVYIGAQHKGRINIDLATGAGLTAPVTTIEPANRLPLPRLISHPYRLYPIVDQIACSRSKTARSGAVYVSAKEAAAAIRSARILLDEADHLFQETTGEQRSARRRREGIRSPGDDHRHRRWHPAAAEDPPRPANELRRQVVERYSPAQDPGDAATHLPPNSLPAVKLPRRTAASSAWPTRHREERKCDSPSLNPADTVWHLWPLPRALNWTHRRPPGASQHTTRHLGQARPPAGHHGDPSELRADGKHRARAAQIPLSSLTDRWPAVRCESDGPRRSP